MSVFQKHDLSYKQADAELAELNSFLKNNANFEESVIVQKLKERLHASCLIGTLIAGAKKPDLYKFEFPLLGTFRADLVVGTSHSRRFVFIEFEGGEATSVFDGRAKAQMRNWSKQLEHGFSQLVDWAYTVNDAAGVASLQSAFGCDLALSMSVLVCGRDADMDSTERKRFDYRTNKISIEGMAAMVLTYDGLFRSLQDQIEAIKSCL